MGKKAFLYASFGTASFPNEALGQSCLWVRSNISKFQVCLAKMRHISKNWESVFDFQYKVVKGQCDESKILTNFACLALNL